MPSFHAARGWLEGSSRISSISHVGKRPPAALVSGKPPPKRGLISMTWQSPVSSSRMTWMLSTP